MNVYKVQLDVNHYRFFLPEDDSTYDTGILDFRCKPKRADWTPPTVYCDNPASDEGDFWSIGLGAGAFATTPAATDQVLEFLEMAGELLDLPFENSKFSVLNVLECVNALDKQKTKFARPDGGGMIKEFAFHSDRLPESTIFKIPETFTSILTVEGRDDPETEFKPTVERLGLKGLIFQKLWEG